MESILSKLKPRQTIYAGITMRSRLEASFAQFLDARERDWTYEPKCYASPSGQYLPDFEVHMHGEPVLFVDVKPADTDPAETLARMHIIRASVPGASLAVVSPLGAWPNHRDWRGRLPDGVNNCTRRQPCSACA